MGQHAAAENALSDALKTFLRLQKTTQILKQMKTFYSYNNSWLTLKMSYNFLAVITMVRRVTIILRLPDFRLILLPV